MRSLSSLVFAALLIAGCASNSFRDNYRSSLERWPSGEVSRLTPSTGKIDLLTSNDIEADATRMMESGYLLLGRSKFQSEQVNPVAAREVADELGASVVLVKSAHAKTLVEAVPVDRWIPSHGGSQIPGGKPYGSSLHGEFRIVYEKKPVDYFAYSATFWAKSKPPIFGVLVESADAEIQQSDSSGARVPGRGVVIRAVINDSPASRAGIRRGDVIVRFAGTEITGPDQFFDTVVGQKGRQVEVEIVRVEGPGLFKQAIQLRDE